MSIYLMWLVYRLWEFFNIPSRAREEKNDMLSLVLFCTWCIKMVPQLPHQTHQGVTAIKVTHITTSMSYAIPTQTERRAPRMTNEQIAKILDEILCEALNGELKLRFSQRFAIQKASEILKDPFSQKLPGA